MFCSPSRPSRLPAWRADASRDEESRDDESRDERFWSVWLLVSAERFRSDDWACPNVPWAMNIVVASVATAANVSFFIRHSSISENVLVLPPAHRRSRVRRTRSLRQVCSPQPPAVFAFSPPPPFLAPSAGFRDYRVFLRVMTAPARLGARPASAPAAAPRIAP